MVEFKAELYPLSEDTCCYCDQAISAERPRGTFRPYGGDGQGVSVLLQLTFCESCLAEIAERCGEVAGQIQRHRIVYDWKDLA